jgi:hypothetical protein
MKLVHTTVLTMILMPRTTQQLAQGKPCWVQLNENQHRVKANGKK